MQNELTNLVSDASKDAKAAQPTDASARLMEAALTFYRNFRLCNRQ